MYTIFFFVGIGFILISFLLGAVAETDVGPMAILQPKLIAVFLVVTGGLGMIFSARWDSTLGAPIVLVVSVASGMAVAGIIHRFVIMPLHRAQNTSAHDKQATIGTWAKVISPIPQGGYGKIKYSVSGAVVTSPAKSEDGGEISNGENVAIVFIEGNTFFVKRGMSPGAN